MGNDFSTCFLFILKYKTGNGKGKDYKPKISLLL